MMGPLTRSTDGTLCVMRLLTYTVRASVASTSNSTLKPCFFLLCLLFASTGFTVWRGHCISSIGRIYLSIEAGDWAQESSWSS